MFLQARATDCERLSDHAICSVVESLAHERKDPLAVPAYEIKHAFGFEHTDADDSLSNVSNPLLDAGVRKFAKARAFEELFSDVNLVDIDDFV
jgi:hypothetical protein